MNIIENQPFTISYDITTSPWFTKEPNGILDISFSKSSGELVERRDNIEYIITGSIFSTTNTAPSISLINDPNNKMLVTLYYNRYEIEWYDYTLIFEEEYH